MALELAAYLVRAVVLEGRSVREVAAAHGVSKSWVHKLVVRYRAGGDEAIKPQSRAPRTVPHRTPADIEDRIALTRKQLTDAGFDAGAATIHYHLTQIAGELDAPIPSISTIWRVLRRRGFVTPQPHKRPRSSWIRFQAALPNELWQSDVTKWKLADDVDVEIITYLDDHSRLILTSRVVPVATAANALTTFRIATSKHGIPAALLTDNGCVYTAAHRGGRQALETELLALGVIFKHSRPYHPQTCGKIERWHQTLKKYLATQPAAHTIRELQHQLDRFVDYYNNTRPHRALNRTTPRSAYDARDKAQPTAPKITAEPDTRVRHDIIGTNGTITLRYKTKMRHIAVGRDHRGTRIIILQKARDVRLINQDGEILRQITLEDDKLYYGTGRPPGPPKGRPLGKRKRATE